MSPVKLFQPYDPVENKWQVLDDSPWQSLSELRGCLLLEDQQKVVLTAWHHKDLIHLVYDLDQDLSWLSSSSLISSIKAKHLLTSVNNGVCQYEGGFCYGVVPHGVLEPMKFGPFQLKKNEEDNDFACSAKLFYLPCPLSIPRTFFSLRLVGMVVVSSSILAGAISSMFLLPRP